MKLATLVLLLTVAFSPEFARSEVRDVGEVGFTTVHEVVIDAERKEVWKTAVNQVGLWWNPDHTVAGDSRRLKISPQLQGCFCERFETGGGVVHMTVTMVTPGVVLRLTGGLGPLGLMGAEGNMTWEFEDADDATRVRFTYAVGGYVSGGMDALAGPVDGVIGEALSRLKAQAETGDADSAGSD